eukprot:jgi/Bigna1/137826/aug1.41_g12534
MASLCDEKHGLHGCIRPEEENVDPQKLCGTEALFGTEKILKQIENLSLGTLRKAKTAKQPVEDRTMIIKYKMDNGEVDVFLHRVLGEGSSGTVYYGQYRTTGSTGGHGKGREVAVKIVEKTSEKWLSSYESWRNELFIAKMLDDGRFQRIVTVLDSRRTFKYRGLVMPLFDRTLEKYCKAGSCSSISKARSKSLLYEIATALSFLHSNKLIHMDVKPGNILLKGEHAYLSDFGFSAYESSLELKDNSNGTTIYKSPEHTKGRPVLKSDVWSFGIDKDVLPYNVPDALTRFGNRTKSLVKGMLRLDPNQRFSILDVLHHMEQDFRAWNANSNTCDDNKTDAN